jgi:hypothetical protein
MTKAMEASAAEAASELGGRALLAETTTALVPTEGRALATGEAVLVLPERDLDRRIRRRALWWSLPSLALSLAALLFVGIAGRDRVRGPERLGDLYFPAFDVLTKGRAAYYNPGDINPTDKNSAWSTLESQTWTRIGCRNAAVQGRGPGHDLTFTVLKGTSPITLAPTMFGCRLVGSDETYATCDSTGSLALQEDEWVTLRSDAGPEINNDAQVYCEVQRYKGDTINSELLRRGVTP